MEDLRSDQDLKSRYDQLLFVECELWCLHSKDVDLYPLLSESSREAQSQLCVKPQTSLDVSNALPMGSEYYFVEVNLLSVNSSADNLEDSARYTALIPGDYLNSDSLRYSRICTDFKAFSEKLENQSVLSLERIQRLMCYFLSCCQSGDCKCYSNTINSGSCIVAWDPLKIQTLLGLGITSDSNVCSTRNICSNNLLYKLKNTNNLNKILKSFLPSMYQTNDSTVLSEIVNQIRTAALSLGASAEDLTSEVTVNLDLPLGGYTSLMCKIMAIIGLILSKEPYLFRFTKMDMNMNAENDSHSCDETVDSYAVRLRGLPWKTEVVDIVLFFRPVCSISEDDVAIMYNSEGRMSGEAYVLIPSIQAYETSLTILHGRKMGKRWIEVIPSTVKEFLICKEISGQTKFHVSPKLSHASSETQLFEIFRNRSVLKLRGLPWSTTETDIVDFFTDSGISNVSVSDIFMGINDVLKPSGEAWVILPVWCDPKEVQKTLNLKMIGKRYIEVFTSSIGALATVKSTFTSKIFGKQHTNSTQVLRVRGLPYNITESEIIKFFCGFKISAILPIIHGRADGRPTGQILIKFSTAEDALKAYLSKNMGVIHNRYIELFPVGWEEFAAVNNRYRSSSSRSSNFTIYNTSSSNSGSLKNYNSIGTNLTGSTMEDSLAEYLSADFSSKGLGSDK